MKVLFCSSCLLLLANMTVITTAQSSVFNQNSNQIQWRKMENDVFKIIFPSQVTSIAGQIAFLLPEFYQKVRQDFDSREQKIPLVLTANSMASNAFVTIAPRRMEWELTPWINKGFGASDWVQTLALHETRHMVQYDYATSGFNRFLYWLGGEGLLGGGLIVTLPDWFAEGDAVYAETVYSDDGRGRLPFFYQHMKMLILENRYPNFDQFLLGSYQNPYPDHYVLGYFLSTYIKAKYNEKIFNVIINETAKYSFWPLRFYGALEGVTGKNIQAIYLEMISDLKSKFSAKEENVVYSDFQKKNVMKHEWVNYMVPIKTGNSIITVKRDLDRNPLLVMLDEHGKETKIHDMTFWFSERMSISGDKIVFDQLQVHPRWGNETYSNLMILDIATKRVKRLTSKGKYYHPSFLQSGEKIVTVTVTPTLHFDLTLVSLENPQHSQVLHSFEHLISYPTDCGGSICFVKSYKNGNKSLCSIDLVTGKQVELMSQVNYEMAHLFWDRNYLYFESAQTGTVNIFRMNLQTLKVEQMTSSKYGAYYPFVQDDNLYYSDFGSLGYDLVAKKAIPLGSSIETGQTLISYSEDFSTLVKHSTVNEKKKYSIPLVEDYGATEDFFNIHSWQLNFSYPDVGTDLQLTTSDYLNRFSLNAGVSKKFRIDEMRAFVGAEYRALYPILQLQLDHQNRQINISQSLEESNVIKWQEQGATFSTLLGHKVLSAGWSHQLSFSASQKIKVIGSGAQHTGSAIYNTNLWIQNYEIAIKSTIDPAYRNIIPRWGSSIKFAYHNGESVAGKNVHGKLAGLYVENFFPGFFANHGFQFQLGRERQLGLNSYTFLSELTPPRGHLSYFARDLAKLTINYVFPLDYLDNSIMDGIYLKRLFSVVFYDHLVGSGQIELPGRRNNSSYGGELKLETNIFRLPFPFIFGLRYLYNVQEERPVLEAIVQLSFND